MFAGTPAFALASLQALVDGGRKPVAVYTQPDRPSGRGRRTTASPVKVYSEQHGIPVMQPLSLKDDVAGAELGSLRPDLLVVAAYGLILPQAILDIPTHGCVNVHASLLPRWRGAAPIQAAILAGDAESGVSLMQMTAGLDCGPVFCERRQSIGANTTAGELHDELARVGGELLLENLDKILCNEIPAVAQDESLATYAGKIQKQDAEIDWSRDADDLHRHVRAYNPVPGAFFFAGDSVRVKLWSAVPLPDVDAEPGTFVQYDSDGIVVACGSGGLQLESLQMPGKRRANAREFVSQFELH